MSEANKCPKCGSEEEGSCEASTVYDCGTIYYHRLNRWYYGGECVAVQLSLLQAVADGVEAENSKLLEALENIVKHQEVVSGTMAAISVSRRIALDALAAAKAGGASKQEADNETD